MYIWNIVKTGKLIKIYSEEFHFGYSLNLTLYQFDFMGIYGFKLSNGKFR